MSSASTARILQRVARNVSKPHHAPIRTSQLRAPPTRLPHFSSVTTSFRKPLYITSIRNQLRQHSTEAEQRPLTDRQEGSAQGPSAEEIAERKAQEPAYEMTFTCRKCLTRSSHRVTKQAYHFGTTLITCPGCKNRHLISDHLKVFSDKGVTIEDILKEKGEFLKKGRLGEDGDIEFYDDSLSDKAK